MIHTIGSKQQSASRIRHFQEFTFINDSSLKADPDDLKQLPITTNSSLLSQAKVGSWLTINQIHAPRVIIRQLENLQFKQDEQVRLVSKTSKASVVVDIKGKLIGIGSEIAQNIVVTLVAGTKL